MPGGCDDGDGGRHTACGPGGPAGDRCPADRRAMAGRQRLRGLVGQGRGEPPGRAVLAGHRPGRAAGHLRDAHRAGPGRGGGRPAADVRGRRAGRLRISQPPRTGCAGQPGGPAGRGGPRRLRQLPGEPAAQRVLVRPLHAHPGRLVRPARPAARPATVIRRPARAGAGLDRGSPATAERQPPGHAVRHADDHRDRGQRPGHPARPGRAGGPDQLGRTRVRPLGHPARQLGRAGRTRPAEARPSWPSPAPCTCSSRTRHM